MSSGLRYFYLLQENSSSGRGLYLSKHVALNHLMRMVNHCPPLLEALRREGYERLAKTFTMRQTLLIYEYLGEP